MVAESSIAEYAIAEARSRLRETAGFDMFATVISQYANSPIILQLVANAGDYIDPTVNFDAFYTYIWNVDTAIGYGLDVLGRIVGVSRVIELAGPEDKYLGTEQATPGVFTFNEGIFYGGGGVTNNFALSDNAYRVLILAKALFNICDGSIPAINQILINLFSSYGNCYVTDGEDMTMTYTFGATLSPVDYAIVSQSGVLPRPAGVLATIVQL